MKSTTTLLALAAAVNASPLQKRQTENDNVHVWDSVELLCKGHAWARDDPVTAAELWQTVSAGNELDVFLAQSWKHEHNWLKNLEDNVIGGVGDGFTVDGCGVVGSDKCNPLNNMNCEDQFNKYGKDKDGNEHILGKTSYWIFQAVKGMNSKFNMLKGALTDTTISTGLNIGQMVSEFEGPEDDTADVMKWLSAAMGFAGTLGGLVPVAGTYIETGTSIMGGIFDAVADMEPEGVDTATISGALSKIFEKASLQIDETLRLAVGGSENLDDYKSLPNPNPNDDWYKSPVAKFFSTGWFILNDDNKAVKVAIDSIVQTIKPKIASNIMKAANLRLVADKRIGSQEECGTATGRQWMSLREGEDYCFYLMRFKPFGGNWGEEWNEATADVYENMATYNLGNRDPYYRAVIDCALSADKALNVDNLGFNNIPVCFFNLEAFFIDHNDSPQCNSNQINKVCPPIKADPIA